MVQRKGALDLESEDLSGSLALTFSCGPRGKRLSCRGPRLYHVSAVYLSLPLGGLRENRREKALCNLSS